jgi:hypothetical protein
VFDAILLFLREHREHLLRRRASGYRVDRLPSLRGVQESTHGVEARDACGSNNDSLQIGEGCIESWEVAIDATLAEGVTFRSHGAYRSSWRGVLLKMCWRLNDSSLIALKYMYSAVNAQSGDVLGLVESANVLRWCSFRNKAAVRALDLML